VKYKDGEKTIVVPNDAEVVNLVPGGKDDLKTGVEGNDRGCRSRWDNAANVAQAPRGSASLNRRSRRKLGGSCAFRSIPCGDA
jgi:hypothetical protein